MKIDTSGGACHFGIEGHLSAWRCRGSLGPPRVSSDFALDELFRSRVGGCLCLVRQVIPVWRT
jgi:hypothetical protein